MLLKSLSQQLDTWSGRRDRFLNLHNVALNWHLYSLFLSSLLSLPATKALSMAFRYSEKFKTCDWEEKCLKYMMNRNMWSDSWAIMQIEKPVKFVTPARSSFSLNLHYSFLQRITEMKNDIKFPLMNSLVHWWSKHTNGFACKEFQ